MPLPLDPEKRAKLLEFLNSDLQGHNPNADHVIAERMLLDLVGDAEIAAAWDSASDLWWYA